MAELESLLQQDIPNGRKALLDSKANLENVANYCQQVYVDSDNKKQALDETKNFTTQSLASVAYQINTLASNMLHMLDIQAAELASMESSINNISMTVDVHKEKVARREIGLLTTNKAIPRNHQIVAPANPDRVVKYVRKPIDYTELDDIGHGVKIANQQPQQGNLQVRRTSKTPSPSVDGRKRDSLTSNTGYGTIRAVRTPTVPTDYNTTKRLPSMYSRTRTNSNSSSGSGSMSSSGGYYSGAGAIPPPMIMSPSMPPPPPMEGAPPPPPPPSMAPPPPPGYSIPNVPRLPELPKVPNSVGGYASTPVYDLPPPPPPPSFSTDAQDMPPPPPTDAVDMPLPPPNDSAMMPPPPPADLPSPYSDHDDSTSTAGSSDPTWAPREYIQKAVAIYDYSAENADELTLREDEIVYVVRKNDDGWFEGVLNGSTGLFPGNYVETISV